MAAANPPRSPPPPLQVGDPAVGKSALVQMFHSGGQRFPKAYNMTCGVEFSVKAVNIQGADEAVEFHIFDTAGQDIFEDMVTSYWEGGKAVMLVYDVTRGHTLEACRMWYGRLIEALGVDSLPGVLVANKVDLRERLVVTRQQGQQMAASLNMQVRAVRVPRPQPPPPPQARRARASPFSPLHHHPLVADLPHPPVSLAFTLPRSHRLALIASLSSPRSRCVGCARSILRRRRSTAWTWTHPSSSWPICSGQANERRAYGRRKPGRDGAAR